MVAATFEVLDYEDASDVFMSSFSSWGPTDDGRIKPDISAKGVNMYSLLEHQTVLMQTLVELQCLLQMYLEVYCYYNNITMI